MLLKFFPGSLTTRDNGILEWLDSHGACHPRLKADDLQSNPGFKILTESSKEFDALDFEKQNGMPPQGLGPNGQ